MPESTVPITHNLQRNTSCVPKPTLQILGNPDGLKFTVRTGYIEVNRPNE